MKSNYYLPFILIIIALFLISCKPSGKDIADNITYEFHVGPEIPAGDGRLYIWFENHSNYCIEYPGDMGVEIYVKREGNWLEVDNMLTYGNLEKRSVYSGSTEVFSLIPDTAEYNFTEPTEAHFIIRGYLCDDKSVTVENSIPFKIIPRQ